MKNKILVFSDHYLPSYDGSAKTLFGIIKLLSEENDFYIVTRDRNYIVKEDTSCLNIKCNDDWILVECSNVLYLASNEIKLHRMYNIIKAQRWDKIYLNSFFSKEFSIYIILLVKLMRNKIPILLSPKGVFHPGTLSSKGIFHPGTLLIKSIKKHVYIWFAKLFRLYKNVIWHCTDNFELLYVRRIFGESIKYKIARDPVLVTGHPPPCLINKESGMLRVLFLSRISSKKNLNICLNVFGKLEDNLKRNIVFDIFGPISTNEDRSYWNFCQSLISLIPKNIRIRYCGEIAHKLVYDTLSKYHLLFLPTSGENFCHVVFESFLMGRPVLIGNDTPWRNLMTKELGADIDPYDVDSFVREINRFINMNQSDFTRISKKCYDYAVSISNEDEQKEVIKKLFIL
ncbi:MAG: glycosyltransferase [Coxiellaceae bacterium]|nr:glycosyltransferase [Coxiellaceae bacterium]